MSTERELLSRCTAVIPSLAPDASLPGYVTALLERGFGRVVVVDDGSGPDYASIFTALEVLEGCTVLRHGVNQGKGRALKTAFDYICSCPELEGTAAVTADADGQHSVKDVCRVALEALEHTDGLVLGARDLRQEHVPAKSKAGNRATSLAFRALYGPYLPDTQTGLRGFPYSLLEWCGEIKGERYEYEMNVLIRAAREKIPIREVEIEAIYYNNNEGTHLRAVRDSWRVFVILISGLGWYTLSALLSAVTDVAVFTICDTWIFSALAPVFCYLWSTLTARIVSSALNYTLNRRFVFHARPQRRAVVRYYILWICQLAASYGLLLLLSWLLPWMHDSVNKAVGDVILAVCSYQIQMHWVFAQPNGIKTRTGGNS